MHLIIGKSYLEKIKKYVQIIFEILKNENILIKAVENKLIFFSNSSSYLIRKEFKEDSQLIIKEHGQVFIDIKTLHDLLNKIDIKKNLEIYKANTNYLQFFSGSYYECDLVLFEDKNVKDINFFNEINNEPIKFPIYILDQCYNRLKNFCKKVENAVLGNNVLINIHLKKDADIPCLEAYASDSYRFIYGEFEFIYDGSFQINIFPSVLSVILQLYKNQKQINFYLIDEDNYLICGNEECSIKIKLDISNYPSFLHWFNMPENVVFSANKQNLMEMINRNLLFWSLNDIQSTFYKVENNKLLVTYNNNERGKCRETLEINNLKNTNVEFYLNNFLLKDLVKSIDSEEIIFKINDSWNPVILMSSVEDNNFKQFILPLRNIKQ